MFHDLVLDEILQERLPPRRGRRNVRGIKRKMSNFPLRRRGAARLAAIDIATAIKIVK